MSEEVAKSLNSLTLSISATKGDKYVTITLISNVATWNVRRSFIEFDDLHNNTLATQNRGIFLPSLPNILTSTSLEYQEYLSKILCRIFWIRLNDILQFIQAPLQFRRAVKERYKIEKSTPIKCGDLKKEGFKNKSYHKRYFTISTNYLISYFDNKQSYMQWIDNNNNNNKHTPKGFIDLLLVNKIITTNINKKYSFHLQTPNRIWKLQCKSDNEKNEWVQFLNNYLTLKKYKAFIEPHRPNNILKTKVNINDNIQELFLSKNNKQCMDTKGCDSIDRIGYVLLFHYQLIKAMDYKKEDELNEINDSSDEKDAFKENINDILCHYINQELYPYNNVRLLNDYFHLVLAHGNNEFNVLYNKITDKLGTFCDIQLCSSFERIEKDAIRCMDDSKINESSNNNGYDNMNLSQKELDILHVCDEIHCYFLHSYDCCMKLSNKQLIEIDSNINEMKQNDQIVTQTETESDINFSIIKQQLIVQKKKLEKHLTFVNLHYGNKNKFVTHYNSYSNNENNENNNNNSCNSFGFKYFYWKHYETNEELDLKYNIGYKINDFYIKPKYNDIKSEIFGSYINQKKWDYLIRKALLLLKCDIIKKLKANNMVIIDNFDNNISPGTTITVTHVLAILIYTNIIQLQNNLIGTYYKNNKNESIIELKERHSIYGNWAKYLFETIHCFGTELLINNKNNNRFYHGIDSLIYFTDNIINFNYPISCSTNLIVIISYSIGESNNGIILQLSKSDNMGDSNDNLFKLHYFNCSIFSDFTFENEYLFNGSWNTLQIDSIYDMQLSHKYKAHLSSLKVIDLLLKGFWMKQNLASKHQKIIAMLFTNELKNWLGITDKNIILQENVYKLPEYVELSFHCFTHKITNIIIDVASNMIKKQIINNCQYFGYSWLRRFIIYSKIYFVNLSILLQLFPNCKTLQILNSVKMAKSQLTFELNEQIFKLFLKLFKSPQFISSQSQLTQIQMSGFDTKPMKIKKLCESYGQLFKKAKWHLQCIDIQETNQILVVMQCIRNKP